MADIPIEFQYTGDLSAIGVFHSKFFTRALVTGNIIGVYFDVEGVTSFTDSWFFGLKVNGVDVLLTTDRPQLLASDLHVEKTGLSIPVVFRDKLAPTIDARGGGTVNGPITVTIIIQDTTGAGVGEAIHAASAKTSLVDADELGIWDSVTTLLKKISYLNLKASLKAYFDPIYATPADVAAAINGNSWKQGVRVATTVAGTLASSFENGDTVDGVALVTGDRILIKDQADPKENGIYVVAASGAPARSTDADVGSELVNASVFVSLGTVNAGSQWVQITPATITLGSTNVVFTKFNSIGGVDFDDLGDVIITSASRGQVPVFDGTDWVNGSEIGDPTGTAGLKLNSGTDEVSLGDINGNGNSTTLILDDGAETIVASKPITIPADPYNSTTWNGNQEAAPKDAVRDALESVVSPISDVAYDVITWNGDTLHGASKNAISDILESIMATIAAAVLPDGTYGDVVVSGGGTVLSIDADLEAIAALTPTNNDIIQRKAGVWTNRTMAQLLADLGLADAMVFKGTIDCSANPNYPAANAGDLYKVSVAGKIGGASGINVEIGDSLICAVDGTASGTQAGVGASWYIVQSNIDGAVIGPASSTSGNIATFNGTTGKTIQDGGKALPSGSVVGTSDTQTLTNKRITARTSVNASSATPTPDADAHDVYILTAQAAAAAFAAPTGTPTEGQPLMLRIKDNGTARALTWDAIYRAVGITLPTTTVISKTVYVGLIYNNTDTKWDAIGVSQQA
jgi:hypothetical protein